MYSCPTDDIHSIYLDKELPFEYIKEYEEHVHSCAVCRQKLERLQKIKQILKADCTSITPDRAFEEESFERLRTKLRYSNNTKFISGSGPSLFKYGIGAAAAVLVAVIIPVRIAGSKGFSVQQVQAISQITPIERPQATSISNQNIVINGNINDNLAHNVSSGNFTNPRFADVDVFRPDFNNSNDLMIKIDVPDFDRPPPRLPRFHKDMERGMDFKVPVMDMQDNYRE